MGHFRDHSKAGVRFKRRFFSTPSLTVVPARGLPWRQTGEAKELHALVVTKLWSGGGDERQGAIRL